VIWKTFRGSFAITVLALIAAFLYAGTDGFFVAAILGVLEISVSFDNAVVNATVLGRMNAFWQKIFLTLGVLIAVIGMRLLFPVVIVCITAKISPVHAYHLAINGGSSKTPGTYGYLLHEAHPAIAAFGGAFLLMLFLNFIFEDREITWLSVIERPLARIGKLNQLPVVVTLIAIILAANYLAPHDKTPGALMAGALGVVVYILVSGLGDLFDSGEDSEADTAVSGAVLATGKAAFALFLYIEVLDATFSFDGVIGAFAITSDPVIIALGLGIGAMYIRSLTVFLVRRGTLSEYVFLEHGAQWAIGALAVLLLFTIKYEVPEVVTGLVGVGFIAAALVSSILRNRRADAANEPEPALVP
jgi:hypothetical protein